MTLSIERKVAGGFACALALLSVIGIVSYVNVARWRDAAAKVTRIENRIAHLATVPGKLSEMAGAEQAFQLTGAEKFSRAHAQAVNALAAELDQLLLSAAEDPGPRAGLDGLAQLCRERGLKPLPVASERSAAEEARQAELRDQINRAVAKLVGDDQRFLSDQERRVSQSATVTAVVVIGGTGLAFGLVGWMVFLLKQDFGGRRQAEESLRQLNDELEARVQDRTAALRQTNESLRASEGRLAGIIGTAMDGIITVDEQQRIILYNTAAEKMFGYPAAELLGQPLNRLIPERFQQPHTELVAAFGRTQITRRSMADLGSILGRRASGEEFPIEASISQIDSGGQKLFTVILRDITDRKRGEAVWRERAELQERLTKIAATAPGVICSFRLRPDGGYGFPYASPAIEDLFGLRSKELAADASALFQMIHPNDRARVRAGVGKSARSLTPLRQEFRFGHPTKGEVWLESHAMPEREPDGGVLWHGFVNDVTVRKRTEEQSLYQLNLLQSITDKAAECIFVTDQEGRVTFANLEAEQVFGFSAAELIGTKLHDQLHHHHPDGRPYPFAECQLEHLGRAGDTVKNHEDVFFRQDGTPVAVLCSNAPLSVGGHWLGGVLVVRDIGESKLAAQALQASHARLETAQELAQMGSFEVNLKSWHVHASRPMCRLLGMNPAAPPPTLQELIEFVHPEDRVHFVSQRRRGEQDARLEAFDFRSNPARGSMRYFAAVFDLVAGADGVPTGYTGTILDITERKRAEAGLRESEERLRQITSSLRDAIWLVDAQTQRVLYVNQSFERICGRSCAEFYQNPDAFNELIHPDDKDRVLRAYFNGALVGALEERHRIVRPDGEVRWVQGRTVPVRNEAGETYRIASLLEDVTKRVEAERLQRSLEEQLRQAQKMEAIGTLAGGIAHDFNNVLAGILGSAELVRMEVAPDHPAQQYLQPIFLACHRARDLVQQILTFSRRRESEKMLLELQPVVEECVKLLRSTIPAMVNITWQADSSCSPVRADPSQLHQVIMNICTNAWHALPPQDGHIAVTLAEEVIGDEAADRHPDLHPGVYVRLSVADNGHGMDAATRQRIFEPFFTTKSSGRGTGLGLSVVHGILKAHEGAILVQSEPGKGATFHVYLPAQTATQPEAPAPPKALAQGAGQRILFVDDEQNLAAVTEKILTRIGYTVTRCCQSNEALERFQLNPAAFDLVITDLAMPGMSGTDLAEAVLKLRATVPILLISGFVDPVVRETALRVGIREVIHKPFSIETLSEAVGRALAGAERSRPAPAPKPQG